MNYEEAVEYIHATLKFGSKPGLARIGEFVKRLGDPHKKMKYVHVAGTNGKGSTTAMISSILIRAGYSAGMYISPFIENFRERIQLGGEMIPEDELALRTTRIKDIIEAMVAEGCDNPTEFTIITGLALDYFAAKGCEVAVLEVGMGGRLDATNIIESPEVSVITSIAYDHMQYLGDTLAKIAYEKCGIIKPGRPVVAAYGQPAEALEVIRATAAERGCELHIPDERAISDIRTDTFGGSYRYDGLDITLNMPGRHQIQNSMNAIAAARILQAEGFKISDEDIVKGISDTQFGGRLEVVAKEPLCLIDGGHNRDGVARLCEYIDRELAGRRLIAIMGMSADKDAKTCMGEVAKRSASMIVTEAVNIRALKADDGLKLVEGITRAEAEPDVEKAVKRAFELAEKDDIILACGSLYMIGDAKAAMIRELST